MKALLPLLVAFTTYVSVNASGPIADDTSHPLAIRKASPFFCNRMALNPAERKRHFDELGPKLLSLRKGVRELETGYEFEFPSDAATYQLLSEWAIQERRCCPFFDIGLRLEPDNGPIWLSLTGRPGTKDFIKLDAPKWVKP